MRTRPAHHFVLVVVIAAARGVSAQGYQSPEARGFAQRLIAEWQRQNTLCQGSNRSEVLKSCDLREVIGDQLGKLDWCFGREGE